MDRRRPGKVPSVTPAWMRWKSAPLPPAVYRDLVSTLFAMKFPIVAFGFLYAFVGVVILLRWPDPIIFGLVASAILVTAGRILILNAYTRAGGASQPIGDLAAWERRYTAAAFLFAFLLAGLNVRVLMVHQPLMHMGAISLVFTFGAGVVSRISCRPRACVGSLMIAVVPTALAMLLHATMSDGQPLHSAFFILFALLLLVVMVMSLDSVRHLHAGALEQLLTRHDLAKLARHDALTGLPNRLMLREAFYANVEAVQGAGASLAVHYLDLDGFKAINDGFGHPVGDKVLKEVAHRLISTARAHDVASRLGGDEFIVIQTGVGHRDEAELLARRIIKQLSDPYVIDGVEMRISVSVGIALMTDAKLEFDGLVACADAALYRAKALGKARLQFCEPGDCPQAVRSAA